MRRTLVAIATLSLLLGGCELFNPLESNQEEAGVQLRVVACERDELTGVASATFELTSEKEYDQILVQGEMSDQTGVVVATTSTSVQAVRPGKTYRHRLIFPSTVEPQGKISCDVHFSFASEGFPD